MDLDPHDLTLLRLLQADADRRLDALAAETGLSPATVQRRLRRLRDGGAIDRTVALVDPAAVGAPTTFLVQVELEREQADRIDAFARAARAEPMVQQCWYVTGEADFVLVVLAPDMAAFEAFSRRMFFDDANVRRFRTSVAMRAVKRGLVVPLPE
ncbi:Lrp/AsnC family transcriptional regulator [Jannaschia sp. Os4]|uniref:Lrp/AsnC family transcriptional regulator n=1 Tax=Jannaschia sp. Os4 TaxID=2807617 RepID=UPI00193A75A4|nr:Lrp/AsnC family transcriptional regulator [Jannaschia sp. Os4]MBM2575641.1 Lrp/AsnC family transcriptional regulator [Jannaschia sp. Os4]